MCGRYYLKTPPPQLMDLFKLKNCETVLEPNLDVRPTNSVPVVLGDDPSTMTTARWGLIPSWAKDIKVGYKMFNARSETVAENGAFRSAFKRRRALVLADGFYEWRKNPDGTKTPFAFTLASGEPFAFAGLWEMWRPVDGAPVRSCTIITTTPNELVSGVHDRMPVILSADDYGTWLDTEEPPEIALSLLRAYPANLMRQTEVSPDTFRARPT